MCSESKDLRKGLPAPDKIPVRRCFLREPSRKLPGSFVTENNSCPSAFPLTSSGKEKHFENMLRQVSTQNGRLQGRLHVGDFIRASFQTCPRLVGVVAGASRYQHNAPCTLTHSRRTSSVSWSCLHLFQASRSLHKRTPYFKANKGKPIPQERCMLTPNVGTSAPNVVCLAHSLPE